MLAGEGRGVVFGTVHADAGVWRACGVGDVSGRGSAVCAREPRRVAEGRAEGVAEPARCVRAGREGVAPAGVACGAGRAWVGEGLLVNSGSTRCGC